MDYISVEEAIAHSGLRLVLTQGMPGPWGEAAKGIFYVKGLAYTAVAQLAGMENEALRAWTGQTSAPVAVYEGELPRTTSIDILYLAERLQTEPALIPADAALRARMFGLIHAIIGENGFGWSRRLMMLKPVMNIPGLEELATRLADKYGYSDAACEEAIARSAASLKLLSETLLQQIADGSPYFIGDQLTALDIYWASFSNMLQPLPHAVNPMPEASRQGYEVSDPQILASADPCLLAHRDMIYTDHLKLPLDF